MPFLRDPKVWTQRRLLEMPMLYALMVLLSASAITTALRRLDSPERAAGRVAPA